MQTTKYNILIAFLSFIITGNSWGQTNFLLVNSNMSNAVTPCHSKSLCTVNIENPSPFDIVKDTVTITLPSGITYIPNSITNGTESNITDLNNPSFLISDMPSVSFYSFTFEVEAGCQIKTFIDNGGIIQNTVDFSFVFVTALNDSIGGTFSHLSEVFPVLVPDLSLTTISNQTYSGQVGTSFTRCIEIVNGGAGKLEEFVFEDAHGAGINMINIDKGTWTQQGLTEVITFTSADFSSIGNNDNYFDPGERITFCETIQINSCTGTSSDYTYYWGCNNTICQQLTDAGNIVFAGEIPDLQFTNTNNYNLNGTDDCYINNNQNSYGAEIVIRNDGTGTAFEVDIELNQAFTGGFLANMYSSLDTSSFTLTKNNGTPVKIGFYNSSNSTARPCLPSNPVGRVYFIIDSIGAGDEVRINWNHFVCCSDYGCINNERRYVLGWKYQGSYKNRCGINYNITRRGKNAYYYRHNTSLDQGPGTLTGSATGSVSFVTSTWEYYMPKKSNNDRFRFEIILPPCVQFDPNSFRIRNATTALMDTPDSIVTNGDTVNVYYDNLSTPWGGTQSTIDFDVSLDCGSCSGGSPNGNIELNVYYSPNLDCNCEKTMSCASAPVFLICGTGCEGVIMHDFKAERINYGIADTDNNGMPDSTDAIDLSLIREDRLMYHDTLAMTHYAWINKLTAPDWKYIYAEAKVSDVGNRLTYLDASLRLYRNGIFDTLITQLPAPTITTSGSDKNHKFEIPIDTLIAQGYLDSNFVLSHNDSLELIVKYVVSSNIGGAIIPGTTENWMYASVITNPVDSADKFGCPKLSDGFSIIGYYYENWGRNWRNLHSCNLITFYQNYYLSIGPCCSNYAGGNLFPFEYRNWATIKKLTVEMPDNYTYKGARIRFTRTAGTLTTSNSPIFDIQPSSINGNIYEFDVSNYFGPDMLNDSIFFGDDGFHGTLWTDFEPNCSVQTSGYLPVRYSWEFDPIDRIDTLTAIDNSDDRISYTAPILQMQTNLVTSNTTTGLVEWDIILDNYSNISDGENLWIGAPQYNSISADSMLNNQTGQMLYPSSTGIFQIGDMTKNTQKTFKLFTKINSCELDSIFLYFGWNCQGYPLSVPLSYCTPQQIKLKINPLLPDFNTSVRSLNGDTLPLCDTVHLEIDVENFQLGNGYNINTYLEIIDGLQFVPNSAEIAYEGGFTPFPDPQFEQGNLYSWDISSLIDSIGINGLIGILDVTKNSYKIRIKAFSSCDYLSGGRIKTYTEGYANCGELKKSNVGVTYQIFLEDAIPSYQVDLSLNTSFITPCLGKTDLEIVLVNNGPSAFGINDSIEVDFDPGVTYTPGSYTGITNPPPHANPNIFYIGQDQYLKWALPPLLAQGDTCRFKFTLDSDQEALSCGVVQINSRVVTTGNALCINSGTCAVEIAAIDTFRNVFVYKGYYSIQNDTAYSTPNAPNGEHVQLAFDIVNAGEGMDQGKNTIIQYYEDSDDDGIFSSGDTWISNDTIFDPINANSTYNYTHDLLIPSSAACKLLAVIDTSLNACSCSPTYKLFNINLNSITTADTTCSETPIQIGNDTINGYLYQWDPSINLSSDTAAEPNFNSTEVYPINPSYNYIRTINRGGCYAQDTVSVKVYAKPIANAGLDQEICNDTTAVLSATPPQGEASGYWMLDLTNSQFIGQPIIIDSSDANTSISQLHEGTYTLLWILENGTCVADTDTVSITIYDLPEAYAGNDHSICNQDSIFLSAEDPIGTSFGEWTLLPSAQNNGNILFTDSSIYNTLASNLQEGTYDLIWTVNNGVCPADKDTAIIQVANSPTANAGPDIQLCDTYQTLLDADSIIGTQNGFWSQDTTLPSPSSITFSDSTKHNPTASTLLEGEYQLYWTIENGACPASIDTLNISVFDQPTATVESDKSICGTFSDTLRASALNGTATGYWQWSDSLVSLSDSLSNTPYATGLYQGDFTFIWTVQNGICPTDDDTLNISIFNLVTSYAGEDNQLCGTYIDTLNSDSVYLPAIGYWNIIQGTNAIVTDSTTHSSTITNLQEGTFELEWVVQSGNCPLQRDSVQITVFDIPTANAGNDHFLCEQSTVTMQANSPLGSAFGYWTMDTLNSQNTNAIIATIDDPTSNVTNIEEEDYFFIWNVANGVCPEAVDTVQISNYRNPVATTGNDQSLCDEDSIYTLANFPRTYEWGYWQLDSASPSYPTFTDTTSNTLSVSNLIEGTYKLYWTVDNLACPEAIDSISINVYYSPTAEAGNDTSLCGEYTYTLQANQPQGTATGHWITPNVTLPIQFSDNTQWNSDISNLQEGTYELIWIIENGTCPSDTDTVVISIHDVPQSNAGSDQQICNDTEATLSANTPAGTAYGFWTIDSTNTNTSGFTFTDSLTPSTSVTNMEEGHYSLIWNVGNGNCPLEKDTIIIDIYDQPTATTAGPINVCDTSAVQLTGNPPIGTASGYWQENVNHTPPSVAGYIDSTIYNTYITNLSEGTYEILWVQENGNCPLSIAPLTINMYDQPHANAGPDQDLCAVYLTQLNGNAAIGLASGEWSEDLSWNNPANIQIHDPSLATTITSSLQEGKYKLVWTLTNGSCPISTDTVQINVYDPLVANAGDDIYLCDLPSTALNANPSGIYETGTWSQINTTPSTINISDVNSNTATASNLTIGTYQLIWQMENEGGCPVVYDTVRIINYPLPVPDFTHEDSVCANACLTPVNLSYIVSPHSLTNFSWYIDNYLDKEIIAPFEDYNLCIQDTGYHKVTLIVKADNGCVDSITRAVPVFVKTVPISGFSYFPIFDIYELTDINFYDESLNRDSIWYFYGDGDFSNQANPVYAYEDSGYYDVTQVVKNNFNCYDSTIKTVYLTIGDYLYIPNAFTPDADGKNELFYPVYRGKDDIKKGYSFMVFNRWGDLLFETTEPNVGWDGRYKGRMSQDGVYTYKVTHYSFVEDDIKTKLGHFTLIK